MRNAVDECIERNILADFLIKNKAGVIDMYLTEWDEEAYRTVLKEESHEDGRLEGIIEGKNEVRKEINELIQRLVQDNRLDDLKQSANDPNYLDQLLGEYGIGS